MVNYSFFAAIIVRSLSRSLWSERNLHTAKVLLQIPAQSHNGRFKIDRSSYFFVAPFLFILF